MLTLCGYGVSNYHNKVRLVLLEKEIPHHDDLSVKLPLAGPQLDASPAGKVPWIEDRGLCLSESQVIVEYLEDAYPARPLLPREPAARAKVRELSAYIELHVELVARRLYREVFHDEPVADLIKVEVERELRRGVAGIARLAKFQPYIAGSELTLADCTAFIHLPIVSRATVRAYGRDLLESIPAIGPYLEMLNQRPAFARISADLRAARAAFADAKKRGHG